MSMVSFLTIRPARIEKCEYNGRMIKMNGATLKNVSKKIKIGFTKKETK